MKKLTILFALLCWVATGGVAHAIYDIGVTKVGAGRIPVGILGVSGDADLEDAVLEARDVMMADLRRSTLFHARDLELHLSDPPDKILGALRLREIGVSEVVEVMLWINLTREGPRWVLTGHIYDGARGRLTLAKRLAGKPEQLRLMVHRFVGELIHQYTGEYGITRSRIGYISDLSGRKEVYVMEYDGNVPTRITSDRNISLTPSLSPDAKRILYSSQKSGGWVVYERDLATGNRLVTFNAPGLNIAPSWHPKGDGYALTASKDGNREIYHVTRDRKVKRLTRHPGDDVSPAWSPDGKRITFTSNRAGSPQIYVMSARGGRAKRITFRGRYNTEPDWSPTGNLIAYTCRNDGFFHICVTDPKGKRPQQLTSGPWDDESPSFSPDGRHIAFSSSRGGKNDIYMMDIDGGNIEKLTYNGANNTSPTWSGPTE